MAVTTRTDVYRPQVNAENVMLALVAELNLLPFVEVLTTLVGRPGDEVTLPEYDFIGQSSTPSTADDGVPISMRALSHDVSTAIIKKTTVGIAVSDEVLLCGEDTVMADIHRQLATAIAVTVEQEVIDLLVTTPNVFNAGATLSFSSIVNANNAFPRELSSEKVLFIHPNQYLAFANDSKALFTNEDTAPVKGEVGLLAGVRIIPSENVEMSGVSYLNNMICLPRSENDGKAVSIYLKRDLNVEIDRKVKNRSYEISADIIFAVALTNPEKAILVRHN